jgi:hypothetical protein
MANFTRRLGGGAGPQPNGPVSSSEHNLLDLDHTKAPNFDEGSAHTPTADIEMTGPFGLKLMAGQQLLYQQITVPKLQPINAIFESGEWTWLVDDVVPTQLTGGATQYVRSYLPNLPDGGILDGVTVLWDGAGGHANDPVNPSPAVLEMPVLELWKRTDLGVPSLVASVTDTTTSRASYESSHPIALTSLGITLGLGSDIYYIRFRGEFGSDFIVGGVLESAKCFCKVSKQPYY